ncbi:Kinesin protein [Rhizoctonia solani]|uniref:Kinesin-like protein n=1 Tax=Rhizoctonia solani TaxID=456999 RepID=A0A8H7ILU3_9AGAM|nr:Kinesin protein [Rhizoctonia solani]
MSNESSSIEVAVRIRPPTDEESEKLPPPGYSVSNTFNGDGHLTAAPKMQSYPLRRVVVPCDDRSLTFDPLDEEASRVYEAKVFDQDAQQIDVFEGTTKKLLDGILDGFNATVFAYGATGCGKTHTISGTDTDPGIIYLTMNELLAGRTWILCSPGGLTLREDKSNRVVVTGLVSRSPTTAEEVKQLVLDGNSRRTQSPTHANQTSSRSHAVLQINVTQSPRTASTTECQTSATLSIIDLAGSERASATRNMANFSLGGNCRTVMIVCVAPTSAHYEDTQNTLKYANRAKEIKTKVSRNFLNVDRHVAQYVEAISRLNDEVAELKAKLAGRVSGDNEADARKKREAQAAALRARDEMQRKVDSAGQVSWMVLLDAQPTPLGSDSDKQAERSLLINLASRENLLSEGRSSECNHHSRQRALRESNPKREESGTGVRKTEARASALEDTVTELSEMVAALSGVVARCSVMMSDAASMLKDPQTEDTEEIMRAVSGALARVSESNAQTLFNVLGQSVGPGQGSSSLLSFNGHVATNISRRSSVAKPTGARPAGHRLWVTRLSHRSALPSLLGALSSRRASPVLPPVTRVPKKAVQWRDLAGEGSLDDARTAVVPEKVYPVPTADSGPSTSSANEMEWEDAEDAVASSGVPEARPSSQASGSRLESGFLKSLGGGSKALGSLTEETPRSVRTGLADVSNQSSTPTRKIAPLPGDDSVVLPPKRVPGSAVKSARRRSGLGLAVAKARRRSSLIPTLSPHVLSTATAASTGGASSSSAGPQRQRVTPSTVVSPQRSPFKIRMGSIGHTMRASGGRLSLMGPGPARQPLRAARMGNERFAGDQSIDLGSAMRMGTGSGRPLWK